MCFLQLTCFDCPFFAHSTASLLPWKIQVCLWRTPSSSKNLRNLVMILHPSDGARYSASADLNTIYFCNTLDAYTTAPPYVTRTSVWLRFYGSCSKPQRASAYAFSLSSAPGAKSDPCVSAPFKYWFDLLAIRISTSDGLAHLDPNELAVMHKSGRVFMAI